MSLELFINSGSINEIDLSRIDGARFEDVFSINMNSCVSFYYNTQDFSIPPVTPPGTLNIPETNTFMFDENVAADWDNVTPTKIRLSLKSIGRLIERTNYQERMFEIIKNRKVGSQITITKYSTTSESDPTSFKTFEIVEANYFERVYDESGQRFYALEWGSINLTETADFGGLFDYLSSSEDRKDGFFTLTVTQVDTGVNSLEPPSQGDELSICITPSTKFGFLDVADAHFDSIQLDTIDIVSASMDSLLVTGSIDVTGSLIFNGEKIESLLNNTKFGSVNFNSSTDTEECPYPLSFRINSNDWRSTVADGYSDFPATKLTFALNLLMSSSGPVPEYVERKKVLYDIIFNGYIDSTISLKSDSIPKTIKRFLVKGGTYYRADITPGPTATIKYVTSVQFGSKKSLIYTDGDPSTPGNPNEWLGLDSDILEKFDTILNDRPGTYTYLEYVQLDVEEYYSNFDQQYYGGNFGCYNNCIDINGIAVGVRPKDFNQVDFGEKFVLDIEVKDYSKRKKILVLDESQDVIVPSWTRKTTIYTIGAGGGGGGGAAGYKHSDNIRFLTAGTNYIRIDFDKIEDYVSKTGHEMVIGGGGGAGGNVTISTFDYNTINGGDELIVLVGDGGDGGLGISYTDDINVTLDEVLPNVTVRDVLDIRTSLYAKGHQYYLTLPIILPQAIQYTNLNYICGKISVWGSNFNGKKGGDTSVWLKNSPSTTPLILASGGLGGSCGFAIRNAWQQWHRVCHMQDHQYDISLANGGGTSKLNSFGNEIRLGGSGGYGIPMVGIIKYPDRNTQNYEVYPTVNDKTINLNKAPNIPWSDNSDIPGLKLPYGHSSLDMNSLDVYKTTSFGIAEQLAPPGGGGGCGVTYYGVDTRNLNDYYPDPINTYDNGWWYDSLKAWRNQEIPDDFTQVISNMVIDKITLGYGGKITINPTLFDDVDSDGVRHTVTLSDGGNGGYATYGISKDAQFGNTIPNTITSPGIGSGGGGGAASFITDWADRELGATGQDGGKGADGLVIIVFES
jgi:hypothetical protein